MTTQPDYSTPPARIAPPVADCAAKRIRADIKVSLSGAAFDNYVANFMGASRSGVCNLSDPTMRAFADRGWKFAYKFQDEGGHIKDVVLDC